VAAPPALAPAGEFRASGIRCFRRPVTGDTDVPPATPAEAQEMFIPSTYERGAMALQALRARVSAAVFDEIMREWATTFRHGNANTGDLIALSEAESRT